MRTWLTDSDAFDEESNNAGGPERAWQRLLESNPWVLGVGLGGQLLTSWNDQKLEQVTTGADATTSGKRVDALLRTNGIVRSMVFAEIKHHRTDLLTRTPYRSSCGAVAKFGRQEDLREIITAMGIFSGRHFPREIILWAVRWYCRYGLSYRDLEEMMTERGVPVDHSTIYRWVQKYAPELDKQTRWYRQVPDWQARSWRVDETYIRVGGKWCYLYRAITAGGHTLDFYLSPKRNVAAAKRFLAKTLRSNTITGSPRVINTDKAPSLARAIAELKSEGICPQTVEHRQVKYLNNVIEGDHGRLKRILGPKGAFKNRTSAYRTLKGMEAMHSLRKGQGAMFAYGQPNPDAVIVSRVFEAA